MGRYIDISVYLLSDSRSGIGGKLFRSMGKRVPVVIRSVSTNSFRYIDTWVDVFLSVTPACTETDGQELTLDSQHVEHVVHEHSFILWPRRACLCLNLMFVYLTLTLLALVQCFLGISFLPPVCNIPLLCVFAVLCVFRVWIFEWLVFPAALAQHLGTKTRAAGKHDARRAKQQKTR